MKINMLFIAAGISCANSLAAQSLSPTVISASGGFTSNAAGMLSSTVGEMTMVETFTAGGSILTQGFQQPEDFNVFVKEADNAAGISFGPNPTNGPVQLGFSKQEALKLRLSICDITGKVVYSAVTEKAASNNYLSLDLSSFAQGDYILECKTAEGSATKPVSFSQKITVIK